MAGRIVCRNVRVAKTPEKEHSPLKWRLEWLAQTGIEKIVSLLPGPLVFRLGEKLGGLAWHLMRSRQHIVLRNLRIAFHGEHDIPTLRIMARQSFRRTGANLLSALHSTGITMQEIDRIVGVERPELLHAALSRAPGIIIMPPHMGNWEILSRINLKFPPGHRIGAFYRPLNNPLLDRRVLKQREVDGSRLFSKGDSFHQFTGFLRDGGILGILADQRVGRKGEVVRFFGRLTRASPLPGLMARRSKVEVLGMSLATVAPGRWRLGYHALEGPVGTKSCMDCIERAMKASPLDVFWMQDRWKVFIKTDYTIRDWLGTADHGPGKPHRALLWLTGAPAGWTLPEEWTHPDVIYEAVIAPGGTPPPWLPVGTRLHEVADTEHRGELSRAFSVIDLADPLPVDYILTGQKSRVLEKIAASFSAALVHLPLPPPGDYRLDSSGR